MTQRIGRARAILPMLIVGLIGLIGLNAAAQGASPRQTPPSPAPGTMYIDALDPELDTVVAKGTVITRVATGFDFTEGPLWYLDKLWFAD